MAVIATTTDTASKEFQANRAAMSELVAELETHRAKAAEGGSAQARERHAARGKLLPARPRDDSERSGIAIRRIVAARRGRHV